MLPEKPSSALVLLDTSTVPALDVQCASSRWPSSSPASAREAWPASSRPSENGGAAPIPAAADPRHEHGAGRGDVGEQGPRGVSRACWSVVGAFDRGGGGSSLDDGGQQCELEERHDAAVLARPGLDGLLRQGYETPRGSRRCCSLPSSELES